MDYTPYARSTLESEVKFLSVRRLVIDAQLDEIYRIKAFKMRDINSEISALEAKLVALYNEKKLAYDYTAELETEVKSIEFHIDRTKDELKAHYSDKDRWFTKAQGGMFLKHNKNKKLPKHHIINQSHGDLTAIKRKIKENKEILGSSYQEKNRLRGIIKVNRKKIGNLRVEIGTLKEHIDALIITSRNRDNMFRARYNTSNLDRKSASLTKVRDRIDAQLLQYENEENILKERFRERVEEFIGRL